MSKVIKSKVEQIAEWKHVARPTALLPQSATQQIFQVRNGRVLMRGLLGQVTVVLAGTDSVPSVTSLAKDAAGATVGTAVTLASTVDSSSLEVGGFLNVEGDGTAIVKSNAGAVITGGQGVAILPQGYVQFVTGASKSGQVKWDLWYQPLDEGADVVAVPLSATGT